MGLGGREGGNRRDLVRDSTRKKVAKGLGRGNYWPGICNFSSDNV